MVSKWQPILAALLIFAAGVVTGGLTVKLSGKKDGGRKADKHKVASGETVVAMHSSNAVPSSTLTNPPSASPGRTGAAMARLGNSQVSGVSGANPSGAGSRERRTDAQMQNLLRRMNDELNLGAEQRQKVEAVVQDTQSRIKHLWDQFPAEFQAMRQKIRTELTPEQRKKFEQIFRQRNDWQSREPFPKLSDPKSGAPAGKQKLSGEPDPIPTSAPAQKPPV